MTHIGLISDTHGHLDARVDGFLAPCGEVWHAGDIGDPQIADRLAQGRVFRGVRGNIDGGELRRLPATLTFEVDGLRVLMTHAGGYPGHLAPGVGAQIAAWAPALFVTGHSHILKITRDPRTGMLHMNPGAAGNYGNHLKRTAIRFTVDNGKVADVEVLELAR